ncbi:hypothetical protein BZA77DRAFT_350439 [Pyronema omphalodes]|nr:hypothetical protein BZA77DRAFT_350439 [Pyronema omphalodes]
MSVGSILWIVGVLEDFLLDPVVAVLPGDWAGPALTNVLVAEHIVLVVSSFTIIPKNHQSFPSSDSLFLSCSI